MTLINPLGLIGLIAIPILIIIYIIKPRYQEKKITSTYIWMLSLKYKKKKRPIQWLQKSLLLFIQLLTLGLLAFAAAKPELLIKDKSNEKIIILDASASMNAEINGVTRFDKAIDKILDQTKRVDDEDPMTIILANEAPAYLTNRESSQNYIEYVLKNLDCTFEGANYEKSIELANAILEINSDAEVILYTDHNFDQNGYVNVVNLAKNEWNAGISDFEAVLNGGYYTFKATIENYNQASEIDVFLNVDNKKYTKTIKLDLFDGQSKKIEINDLNISNFTSAKLTLQKSGKEIKDSFEYDNEFMYYQGQNKKFNVQLVGEEVNFINASLLATGLCNVNRVTEEEIQYEGYDIYVFDSFVPEQMPTDGTIWLFNCPEVPEGLDYKINGDIEGDFNLQSTDTDTLLYQKLMANTFMLSNVSVTKYQLVSSIDNYEVMVTCDGDPVIFAGRYKKASVVIFALDIHYTELPVDINMPIMINNMVKYSAHHLAEKYEFNVGENITLYPKLNTVSMTINGKEVYTSNEEECITYYTPLAPGRYEVKQKQKDGTTITNYFFVRIDEEETNFDIVGEVLAPNEYISSTGAKLESTNNIDILLYISILLLLLIVFEWGLSYHEQY